jgi:hypothetical protein
VDSIESEIEEIIREKNDRYEEWLTNLVEYHNGEFYKYKPTVCQEGYCLRCELNRNSRKTIKKGNRKCLTEY